MPVEKKCKRFQKTMNGFVYRYGFQELPGDENHVIACVEETKVRMPMELLRKKIEEYNSKNGINDIFNEKDYI